jgi:hypothetical protein
VRWDNRRALRGNNGLNGSVATTSLRHWLRLGLRLELWFGLWLDCWTSHWGYWWLGRWLQVIQSSLRHRRRRIIEEWEGDVWFPTNVP